jgi:hypothetical protein
VEERVALAVFIRHALRTALPAVIDEEIGEIRTFPFFQIEENMKRAKAFGVELRLQWRWSEPADMTVRFRGEMESGEAAWGFAKSAWDFTWDRAQGLLFELKSLRVPPDRYVPLEVVMAQLDLEAQQELARGLELLGLPWEGIHSYNLYPILGGLLRWKVWITDNIRPWPAEEWALDEKSLWGSPSAVDLSDGRMLPLYLLRLSHGGREERERFQRILERFKELTGQKAAIRVRWEN